MAEEIADHTDPGPESSREEKNADFAKQSGTNESTTQQQNGKTTQHGSGSQTRKQISICKKFWDSLQMDKLKVMLLIKGSIPPTIAIAAYQSTAWANKFATLGYLIAIMSILGFCIMPRGQFITNMLLNVFSACLAAAVNLLAIFCWTQARLHTISSPAQLNEYNASASTVCAIWLMIQIYIVNAIRVSKPQFQFPTIIYSIFTMVICTYGTRFPTMQYGITFLLRIFETFLTGFGIAIGVHFFVFPISSRQVVFKEFTGYLSLLSGMLKAEASYMQSVEDVDPLAARRKHEEETRAANDRSNHKGQIPWSSMQTPASLKLREIVAKTLELHAKIQSDIAAAKREIAIGKLESHDITEFWRLCYQVFVPVTGINTGLDILERVARDRHWDQALAGHDEELRTHQLDNLHFLMRQLREPFAYMSTEIGSAITHVLVTLELVDLAKKKHDEESIGDDISPGDSRFTEAYRNKVEYFYKNKEKTLEAWCREHNIDLPPDFFDSTFVQPEKMVIEDEQKRERYQRQLFYILYLEYLLCRASKAVLDLVLWAEQKKQQGRLKRWKLIFPGSRTLYNAFKALFSDQDYSHETSFSREFASAGGGSLNISKDFAPRKDPEHLPPRNSFERAGDFLRMIPRFLRGEASAFGFRVSLATMTIGVICFLEATQTWFIDQRLLWAMIMVAISMTRTSGQSLFQFGLRVIGTAVAMIASYIIWYIVDGHVAGVIVFFWLWMAIGFYMVLRFQKIIIATILSLVTVVLVIGYELQVHKIGVEASESNGQPAYPVYELAPYRLATVACGLFVAYVWTVFPYPVSESTVLRNDLGAMLYTLSNFYSIVHETVQARVRGTDGNEEVKGTHAYYLTRARGNALTKLIMLLSDLRMNAQFTKFQLTLGGRFPRDEYQGLIKTSSRLLQYIALIGFASQTFSRSNENEEHMSQWSADFRKLVTSVNGTSHQITSLLSMLSSSLATGQPLPPYVETPQPFQFIKQLESIDADLLSVRHIAEPEYSAFAVIQICAQCITADVTQLTKHVTNLVGEVDFSFRAIQTSAEREESSSFLDDDIYDKDKPKRT